MAFVIEPVNMIHSRQKLGKDLLFCKELTLDKLTKFLNTGLDPNTINNSNGLSLLCYTDNIEIAKLLIENGANIHYENEQEYNSTPIFYQHSNLNIAKLLLENGANINHRDSTGKTPLFFCESVESATLFVESGAEINVKDNDGKSLLDNACSLELLEYFISLGMKF